MPLAYSSSEPWVRKIQIPAHSKGLWWKRESEVDWQCIVCGYCWEQDKPTEQMIILYWNCEDFGSRATRKAKLPDPGSSPQTTAVFSLWSAATSLNNSTSFHPSLAVQALVCGCLHLPPLCQLAGATFQKDARWLATYFSQPDFQIIGFCRYLLIKKKKYICKGQVYHLLTHAMAVCQPSSMQQTELQTSLLHHQYPEGKKSESQSICKSDQTPVLPSINSHLQDPVPSAEESQTKH